MLGLSVTSWALAGAGVLSWLLYRWLSRPRDLPPGPFAWPLVGNMLSSGRMGNRCLELVRRFGPVSRLWMGPRLVVVLGSYETIHEALVKQSDVFSNRPHFIHFLNQDKKNIARGVIWQNGEPWKVMRRLMLQTMRDFGVGKRSLEERIQEEVNVVSSRIEAAQGSPQFLKADLQRATTNIICSIVFGRRWDYQDEDFRILVESFTKIFASQGSLQPVNLIPWLRYFAILPELTQRARKSFLFLRGFFTKNIQEHVGTFDPSDLRDLVDVYLKAQQEGLNRDVVSTQNMLRGILDIFLAGSETTATSIDWCIFFMILYPDVQKKCQQEIDQVVGQGRMVNMADRNNLPYLSATLQEVQRLGTTVVLSLPHYTTRETTLGGYTIPAESVVVANLRAVHLDPALWDDPMTFRPDRFLDEEGRLDKAAGKHVITFSVGPRMCLGESLARMEIFLFFANLLQRFSFSKVKGSHLDTSTLPGVTNGPRPYQVVASRR